MTQSHIITSTDRRRTAPLVAACGLALAALCPVTAEAYTLTGGPVTVADSMTPPTPGDPYPSQVQVPAQVIVGPGPAHDDRGIVTDVNLRLDDLEHDFPSDVDVLLVGPGGQSALLLSDAGESDIANKVDLTFDDQALGPAPDPLVSGAFLPTNVDDGLDDVFPAPAPRGPFGSALAVFNETDPEGTWSLYVVDDEADVSGSIGGWRVSISDRQRHSVGFATGQQATGEGARSVTVTVTRPLGGIAGSVSYAAVPAAGSPYLATPGADFEPVSGTLGFGPGETSQSFTVPIVDDRSFEYDEPFQIVLTSTAGDARLPGPTTETVTIDDDEPLPPPALRRAGTRRVLKLHGVALTAKLPVPGRLRATGTIGPKRGGAAIVRLRPARTEAAPGYRTDLFLRLTRNGAKKLRTAFRRHRHLVARIHVNATFTDLSSGSKIKLAVKP